MTERYVAGLDVGTTGSKIVVYDAQGQKKETFYREYDVSRAGGLHEMDFGQVREGVYAILKQAANAWPIEAIGVTSFGETFAMLDENDQILAPSMVYTDPRGKEEVAFLTEKVGYDRLCGITGLAPHPMYSVGKIMWRKNNNSDLYARTKHILLGQDFIIYSLTGVACMDYALATRTAAFDVEKLDFSEEVLNAAGIDRKLLSKPVPFGTPAGKVKEDLKKKLGIRQDITVVAAAHDQCAAMIGSGIFSSDMVMDGTGTVECIPVLLDKKPADRAYYDCGYSVIPYLDLGYACYAFSYTGGATIKWFRDRMAPDIKKKATEMGSDFYAEYEKEIKNQPSGLLVLPHFAGAATPYMDQSAQSAVIGMTLETDRADLYKALMEGTAYEMRINFEKMQNFMHPVKTLYANGGGAKGDAWLQIKADILNKEVVALDADQAGAAGSAAMAGVAVGLWPDLPTAVVPMSKKRKSFYPDPEKVKAYDKLYRRFRPLYQAVRSLDRE